MPHRLLVVAWLSQ